MTETTVELHNRGQTQVLDIAVGVRAAHQHASLSRSPRETVWSLDADQVLPLQHRIRPCRNVVKNAAEQGSIAKPGPDLERGEQSVRRRTPALHRIADDCHGSALVTGGGRKIENGWLKPDPWWRVVMEHVLLEPSDPGQPHARARTDPPMPFNCQVNNPTRTRLTGAGIAEPVPFERRKARQGCRRVVQDCRPLALCASKWTGVVHIGARMDLRPFAASQHPGDVVVVAAVGKHLGPRKDVLLAIENGPEGCHLHTCMVRDATGQRSGLTSPCGELGPTLICGVCPAPGACWAPLIGLSCHGRRLGLRSALGSLVDHRCALLMMAP